jgi:cell division septum initiation protein DivIVA
VALDRTSIVRTFPTARRGYDQGAVDAHLAAMADEAEAVAAHPSSLSEQSAEQVRAIVEAAETSAARIRADAEREARERVAHAAAAADRLVAAVDRLRAEAERLHAEVAALRSEADAPAPVEPERARSDDEAAARIVALDLALAGAPREEADRRLAEGYELPDRAALLDEVYAAAGA